MVDLDHIKFLLKQASKEERRTIYLELRKEFPVHRIESEFNTTAEVMLEAIARSSDLTLRGIKGVIAEASFLLHVLTPLLETGWKDEAPIGNFAYDFLLDDGNGGVKVQVKMQRSEAGKPKLWKKHDNSLNPMFVVETQKTRGGKDSKGANTRPYRFGEFDILAVSLHASSKDWSKFVYTVANWLVPRPGTPELMQVLQPVSAISNSDWTNDFTTAVKWHRENLKRTVQT